MNKKLPQMILSIVFIIGYFAVLGALLSGLVQLPDNMRDVSIVLLGILAREISAVMGFWFGSSSGSKDKSDQLIK